MLKLDWAEPGDPPHADYASVRAKPLPKPIKYAPLTQEIELDLVRRYHQEGDLRALDWLVGAHRPMVVGMAKRKWRGEMSITLLVEYGMLGVRFAAEPPRPSKTKKGAIVGFDPSKGYRFNTIARYHAEKEMNRALGELRPPQDLEDTNKEFDAWVKTPIPDHIVEATKHIPDEDHDADVEMISVKGAGHRFVGYVLGTICGKRRRGQRRAICWSRQQRQPVEPTNTRFVDFTNRFAFGRRQPTRGFRYGIARISSRRS
jgi:hypothetical protein